MFGSSRARVWLTTGTALLMLSAGVLVRPVPARADVGDCDPTVRAFGFSSTQVAFGDSPTLTWDIQVPDGCGTVFELSGNTRESFDQFVGAQGSIIVTPAMLSFGVNDWDMSLTLPNNSDLSWHVGNSVTVTMPAAKPPGSTVTISDDSVRSRVDFVSGVMASHATVRIAGNVNLDLSSLESIPVAAGVQILGDRSVNAAGPRIFTRTVPRQLLKVGDNSDDVRVSGIRLEGGESDDPFSGVGPRDSDGIGVYASQHVEIDHDELYHWRGAGVNVHDGNGNNSADYLGRLNQDTVDDPANARNVWVHDNYIHHNQHPSAVNCLDGGSHAGGYGVVATDGAYVKIERNVFNWNRHSIAGDGSYGTGYVARDNLILQDGGVHFKCVDHEDLPDLLLNPFAVGYDIVKQVLDAGNIYHTHAIDMHGVGSCGHFNSDHNCHQAGEYMDIEDNTILYTAGNGIHLRGTPVLASSSPPDAKIGMDVKDNVFAHTVHDGGYITTGAMTQNEVGLHDLGNTLGLNTFSDRKRCDFDGDTVPDDFIATGIGWWYASSLLAGRWVFLNRSTTRVTGVTLGDVDGDHRCDVTANGTVLHNPDPQVRTVSPGAVTTVYGEPVSLDLFASGGTPGYTWTVTGLPPGLSASPAGHISGMPSSGSSSTVTAQASDSHGRTSGFSFVWSFNARVPGVQGADQATAQNAIAAAGLSSTVSNNDDCASPGDVEIQNPLGGVSVPFGSSVQLTVSTCGGGGGDGGDGGGGLPK